MTPFFKCFTKTLVTKYVTLDPNIIASYFSKNFEFNEGDKPKDVQLIQSSQSNQFAQSETPTVLSNFWPKRDTENYASQSQPHYNIVRLKIPKAFEERDKKQNNVN